MQEEGEPIDEFITSLYSLAESFGYATLHYDMIRDKIVVGVRDKILSEILRLYESSTLEKALKTVRQFEAVRKQQDDFINPYNLKNRILRESSGQILKCAGMFTGKLKCGDVEIEEPIYVTYQMSEPLLNCNACVKLKLLVQLNSLKAAEKKEEADAHMNALLSSLPITNKILAEIFEGHQHDIVVNLIEKYLVQGWPEKKKTAERRIKILVCP
ncbi:hypothetical protein LAZ67_X003149 [Cordylochernes scorpioides]|uniref:Uncharacterized protein n=1 Tax=Cordylochernes scorpioides TaxID=51811 RepID=A0ABY6LWJ2_9ARAC|nr:hypothetical protein LAZ67_X003149 [Cordylochernes scorpioides]